MKKHLDQFSTATGFFIIGTFTSLQGLRTNKETFYVGGFILLIGLLWLAWLYEKGTAKIVENNYNSNLSYKPEKSDFSTLKAKQTNVSLDGICTNNKIRKFRNGVHVAIDDKGEAKAVNFISRFFGQSEPNIFSLPENWNKLIKTCNN